MPSSLRPLAVDPCVTELLAAHATVAVGVSGGKDSQAVALAVARHLDAIGHTGPRVLIHADLGRVEWRDSLPVCERLAAHLGWELLVVRRRAGDMLDRWESRWVSRSEAYVRLETVLLTLPWSTPGMRFCTGEMKTDVISRELRQRLRDPTMFGRFGQTLMDIQKVWPQVSVARRAPRARARAV